MCLVLLFCGWGKKEAVGAHGDEGGIKLTWRGRADVPELRPGVSGTLPARRCWQLVEGGFDGGGV